MGRPKKIVSQENIQRFQRELELAGNNADVLLSDKKGRSRSCLLCRRRKQRCDRKQPSCTNCLKAKVKCIQPARYNSLNIPASDNVNALTSPTSLPSIDESTTELFRPDLASMRNPNDQYTLYLENKIIAMEKLLKKNEYTKDAVQLPAPDNGGGGNGTGHDNGNGSRLFSMVSPYKNNNASGKEGKNGGTSLPALRSDSLESIDFSKCIFAKYNLKEFINYDPAFEFDEMLSRSFLDTFFTRLQFKYPLLDEQEIHNFHEDYISNNIHSYSESGFHFACGRMWLVFSISACLYMTTGKYKGLPPVRYFSTAIRHITRCGQSLDNVQRIELLTLLVLYILRTDRDSSVLYEIIKDVMSICKDKLGINNWQPNDPFADKKLRIFWCVYLLERMICVAVGRPYTISEREINLPLFSEGSFNTRQNNNKNDSQNRRGVHFINQSLKLRRIESQFVEFLQILPLRHNKREILREQIPMVQKFFQDLEIWRSSCSKDDVRNFENETLKLYYYRSVRLLIQPYLEFLTPEDRLFRECQAAAGQICQLYKIFHQKTVRGHSTPAIHTVFVAGVTLIYCMWLARNNDDEKRKKLGDDSKHTRPLISASLFSTMDDLRACSVCLYVMTERSNFARTFRDTFDQLMNATVGNLIERCGPNSSELIYLSSTKGKEFEPGSTNALQSGRAESGMPPATNRTFGKRQAEEHVGFVEISQVDPEEQKEFKRKQGVLEKTSVPKSLSHLLIKVEENQADKNGNGQPMSEDIHKNQYIVKKPANSTEFDWKSFQQQAFLQQQVARENLKAYLSSLNYNNGSKSNVRRTEAQLFSPAMTQKPVEKVVHVKAEESSSNNSSQILSNMTQVVPSMVSNSTTNSNSPNSLLNGGILFNNGTHDMINDISTWTNDSVAQLVGTDDALPIDFNPQENISFDPREEPFLPQIRASENLGQGSSYVSPNGNAARIYVPDSNVPERFLYSPGIETSINDNESERKRRNVQLPSATARDSMVEKFWTVNDDYGFLT